MKNLVLLLLFVSSMHGQDREDGSVSVHVGLIEAANTVQTITAATEKAIQAVGIRSSIYGAAGNAYMAISQFGRAVTAYQQALNLNPRSGIAYNRLGLALLNINYLRQAEVAFKAGITMIQSVNSKAIYAGNLALVYEKLKEYENMKKAVDQSLAFNPNYSLALEARTRLQNLAPQLFQQ